MTDTKPEAKPGILDRFRAGIADLLDSLGAEDGSEVEADEVKADADADADAELDADAADQDAEGEAEEHADGEADAEDDTTPGGTEDGDAEVADLRAKIIEQAALIETQRNALAQAGIGMDADEADTEVEDDTEEISEEDAIAAFDEDYAAQEAALAKIKES